MDIKLHITCDISNHMITSVQITDEHEADGKSRRSYVRAQTVR
ncbi:MAG: hypothetical protein ACP5NC_06890 [Nitrososphaeria archaeon]